MGTAARRADSAASTYEERRESRAVEIESKLLDLQSKRLVNRQLVGKALRIIGRPVEELTDAYRALDDLLEQLRLDQLTVGDFTARWYVLDEDSLRKRAPRPRLVPARFDPASPPRRMDPPERQPEPEAPTDASKPAPPERAKPPAPSAAGRAGSWPAGLTARLGLVLVLIAVFVTNYFQTALEEWLKHNAAGQGFGGWLVRMGHALTRASHELEGSFSFGAHDATDLVVVYGYSVAYFFVFPALSLLLAAAFYRRPTIAPFRVLTLAVAIDYAVSLPFFVFFPVVERWTYPESDAIMLSDLWSSHLIDFLRPISGLDNCFPSFHVSMTVILVLLAYRFRLRGRWALLPLGVLVVLSTFVLGIHWIADMVAGLAVGALSVASALSVEGRLGGLEVLRRSADAAAGDGGAAPAWLARLRQEVFGQSRRRGVFVSYRRQESHHITGRIADHLKARYHVFKDVDGIAPGEPWRQRIEDAVRQSDVLFVVIGPGWARIKDDAGNLRLDSGEDFVRFEIETAFGHDSIRVVPLLVDGADVPKPQELPPPLRPLVDLQAAEVRNDPYFHRDMDEVMAKLETAGQS